MKKCRLKRIVITALLIIVLFICGCTGPKVYDEKGWIILPEYNDTGGKTSSQLISDYSSGDYNNLALYPDFTQITTTEGEKAEINIFFENEGDSPLEIEGFPPEFLIKDPSDLYRPYSIIKRYSRGRDVISIPAGDKREYSIKWNLTDDQNRNATAGIYILEITDVMISDGITEEAYSGEMGKEIAEIIVKPEGKIFRRNILLEISNESEVLNLIFDGIDAEEYGAELYFSISLPESDDDTKTEIDEKWLSELAERDNLRGFYSIDGKEEKYLWNTEYLGSNNNSWIYRFRIEPLPYDVKNISVTIIGSVPVQGEWTFEAEL